MMASGRYREPDADVDELARRVIGVAIEVHRHLGPGFLESVYEEPYCLGFLAVRSVSPPFLMYS